MFEVSLLANIPVEATKGTRNLQLQGAATAARCNTLHALQLIADESALLPFCCSAAPQQTQTTNQVQSRASRRMSGAPAVSPRKIKRLSFQQLKPSQPGFHGSKTSSFPAGSLDTPALHVIQYPMFAQLQRFKRETHDSRTSQAVSTL